MATLRNFVWQREDQPQNLLAYVFLFINFVYGITFTFFSFSAVVQGSEFVNGGVPPVLWGIACLILVVLTLYTIAYRPQRLGEAIGFLGVCVWSYGLALYLISGTIFVPLAIYVPQVIFWSYWYIGVKRYFSLEAKLRGTQL